MKSIQTKLTVTVLIIFLAALSVLGGLNYWKAREIITEDITTQMGNTAVYSANGIGDWFEMRKAELRVLASNPAIISGNLAAIVPLIAAARNENPIYDDVVYVDSSGSSLNQRGQRIDVAKRPYFKPAMQGEEVIIGPMISKGTGHLIAVVAIPIKADGSVVGVLFGAVRMEEVAKKALEVKIGKTGYGYIMRNDGLIIVHPSEAVAMKINTLQNNDAGTVMHDAVQHMIKGDNGVVNYDYKGINKMMSYAPVPGTSWSLAVTVPTEEVMGTVSTLTVISLITIVIVLIIAAVVIAWFARRIARPIQELEAAANRIAAGDISLVKLNITSNDEIGRLGHSFEQMAQNLRNLIKKIMGATEQLAASSEELTANAEQSAQAAEQVATAITDVAAGTAEQLGAANDASAVVAKISASIQQVAANVNQVAAQSAQTADRAKHGGTAVEKAVGQMVQIENTVNTSAQVVAKLGERSKEIGQIVDTISGIAGQTNLLALNAAIEAARAGEQGRGFAVVAEEVRKLAEQSQEAAKKIAELIGEIQQDTDKAVEAMNNGTREVKIGADVVNAAGGAFREITELVNQESGQVQGISEAVQQMAIGSQQIVGAVNKIDSLSKKSAGETQNVSAATEEQLASMEEIATSSRALAQLAQELQTVIVKFRL